MGLDRAAAQARKEFEEHSLARRQMSSFMRSVHAFFGLDDIENARLKKLRLASMHNDALAKNCWLNASYYSAVDQWIKLIHREISLNEGRRSR